MTTQRIALIGLGAVGQGLLEILQSRREALAEQHDLRLEVVAVVTRTRGTLVHPDGLDIDDLLTTLRHGATLIDYPEVYGLTRGWDVPTLLRNCNADVMVEASPTNLETAQPALDYCRAAFDAGMDVVLANKGPVAVAYSDLLAHARKTGRRLRCEATVMAGTPAIRLAQGALRGCIIQEARGILNGTTNFILSQMESGLDYEAALAEAQRLGYAEADPTADVEGWDAAGKLMILARLIFGVELPKEAIRVQGIRGLRMTDILAAQAAGERWKLVAQVTPTGGQVAPARLPLTDPLAGVMGALNAITYRTDLLGEVTLVGPGAGRLATGFGVLSDLIELATTAPLP